MESNGTGRVLSEPNTRALEARLKRKFDKIEAVPGRPNTVKCNCTVPRGYWFGMPLLIQRDPRLINLDQLFISAEKVRIHHGICAICNTLYFTEDHADTVPICEQHPSSVEAEN